MLHHCLSIKYLVSSGREICIHFNGKRHQFKLFQSIYVCGIYLNKNSQQNCKARHELKAVWQFPTRPHERTQLWELDLD